MTNISETLTEIVKAISTIVLLGTIWLLVQSAHRRQQCRRGEGGEGLEDGELPNCSGCHRIGACHRSGEL